MKQKIIISKEDKDYINKHYLNKNSKHNFSFNINDLYYGNSIFYIILFYFLFLLFISFLFI